MSSTTLWTDLLVSTAGSLLAALILRLLVDRGQR